MSVWGRERTARLYDRQLGLERTALDAAIDLAEVGANDRLLDLATGTGGLLRRLADRAAAPHEAIGIDSSAAMLRRAPALPEAWRLVEADATHLPFPAASFDVVSAAYLLHLLGPAERGAVLAEACRVIRPLGRLVAVTVAPPRSPRMARLLAGALSQAPGTLVGLRPLDPRPDLEAAGFEVVGAQRTRRGYPSLITLARIAAGRGAV
ncbi:MAG: methyltransferase domain-containing protein [Actinobacteria bacterium]|nr:methyltransferase domain-containing protein [Actinomycetota bacterium]